MSEPDQAVRDEVKVSLKCMKVKLKKAGSLAKGVDKNTKRQQKEKRKIG